MNPLESQLAYPFGDSVPTPGTVHDVVPGLRWLRMPLPFALDHINLWLLDDDAGARPGYTLVDCGAGTDATRAAWEQLFAGPINDKPLRRVLATHCHRTTLACPAGYANVSRPRSGSAPPSSASRA
jgi:hypothetical protein